MTIPPFRQRKCLFTVQCLLNLVKYFTLVCSIADCTAAGPISPPALPLPACHVSLIRHQLLLRKFPLPDANSAFGLGPTQLDTLSARSQPVTSTSEHATGSYGPDRGTRVQLGLV
ncbi:hypothetical protein F5Y15DRAFT_346996 [Xylariaceae sp. FL0016]|nr:hypothetical protein F5Y15DRAFT_346996 [Xylariaceae sp. FL0016]